MSATRSARTADGNGFQLDARVGLVRQIPETQSPVARTRHQDVAAEAGEVHAERAPAMAADRIRQAFACAQVPQPDGSVHRGAGSEFHLADPARPQAHHLSRVTGHRWAQGRLGVQVPGVRSPPSRVR